MSPAAGPAAGPAPVDPFVIGYVTLRQAVGWLGLGLPFVLVIGGMLLPEPRLYIEPSLSDYYYTPMRNVFVGTLCAIAVFMLSYHGFDHRDDYAGDAACAFALGVALCPTTPADTPTLRQQMIGNVHYVFAAGLFLTLSYFSLRLFTLTDTRQGPPTPRKLQRNAVYRACGWTMLVAIGLILLLRVLAIARLKPLEGAAPVFWLETAAILAFGLSWMTKSEAILADR